MTEFSLIKPDQDFALWAVLFGLAAFGFWCERFPWGRKYSGVMIMMTLGILLSNLKIIPTAAPVYDTVWDYLVPLAIALLLLGANLRTILKESGPVLIAFLIGSATVVAGTLIAVSILDLGESEAQLAGIFAAGDICSKEVRQVSVATSEGTIAALSVREYLNKLKP